MQNELFQLAQQICVNLNCFVFLSLREESFWANKEFGVLSAFHSTAFQISAPRVEQVLAKRFKFAQLVIKDESDIKVHTRVLEELGITQDDVLAIIRHIHSTLLGSDKRFIRFLEYMNPGEVRRALDFVARFLSSGHTNINAISERIDRSLPPIGYHEFLKSIILGDHSIYNETYSDIINLFGVDGRADESHFNRIAVLARIISGANEESSRKVNYISYSRIVSACANLGISTETCQVILGKLLKSRLIACDTLSREDYGVDSYFRPTSAAIFHVNELLPEFTYIEIVLDGTGIRDHSVRESLNNLAIEIEKTTDRLSKLEKRIDRVGVFLDYLKAEFEKSSFSGNPDGFDPLVLRIVLKVHSNFSEQRLEVLENAKQALMHRRGNT